MYIFAEAGCGDPALRALKNLEVSDLCPQRSSSTYIQDYLSALYEFSSKSYELLIQFSQRRRREERRYSY